MRYPVERLIPAIPTILFAGILSIDFADIVYTLYLSALGIFFAIFTICLVVFLVFVAKTKDIRHPLTLAAMILLIGVVLLPILESPISSLVKHHTNLNRVSAFIRDTYQEKDSFDFTITAHGTGSKDRFTLEKGYTNVSINNNHYEGPSLYYRLRPNIEILLKDEYECMDIAALRNAYEENQLSQLSGTIHITSFNDILESLSSVDSENAFVQKFHDVSSAQLDLVPYGNAVYRVVFGIIAFVALLLSSTLYRQKTVEQSVVPNP